MYGDAPTIAATARTGHDTLVFGPDSGGEDFVYDFEPGKDHIEVDGAAQSFGDLGIEGTDADGDGTTDSIVHFDEAAAVTVYNVF